MDNYVCKIATLDDITKKWDNDVKENINDESVKIWRDKFINSFKLGNRICYYGYLNDEVITEASVIINKDDIPNGSILIDDDMGYLVAFKTKEKYQGLGYFSNLYHFMENDLRKRGYKRLSLGVEPKETRNRNIYFKWGYTNFIMQDIEGYPNGEEVIIDFYYKNL